MIYSAEEDDEEEEDSKQESVNEADENDEDDDDDENDDGFEELDENGIARNRFESYLASAPKPAPVSLYDYFRKQYIHIILNNHLIAIDSVMSLLCFFFCFFFVR